MSDGFLLDTNVPSELTRPSPDLNVISWVGSQDQRFLYLSVISVGELRRGFSLLAAGKRRTQLEHWFENSLLSLFGANVLPITQSICDRWGALAAARQLQGASLAIADGLIAATALEYGLTLVTRNTKDSTNLGVTILNPWDDQRQ